MIETLNTNGANGCGCATYGVLFRGSSEGKSAKKLIEENLLDAVIGLQKSSSSALVYTTILIFKKHKDKNVLFIVLRVSLNRVKTEHAHRREHSNC